MFEKMLNQKVREFRNRANDENKRWQSNVIVIDKYHTYYVEYYQERLYWVYDYNTRNISMVYAGNPSEAVRQTYYNTKNIVLNDNSNYIEKIDTLILKDDE